MSPTRKGSAPNGGVTYTHHPPDNYEVMTLLRSLIRRVSDLERCVQNMTARKDLVKEGR